MGIQSTLLELRRNIKKAHPEMTAEQVSAEAERYYTRVMRPILSEGEIVDFIESYLYRPNGVPARELPHYSNAERLQRREFSRQVRRGVLAISERTDFIANHYKYRLDDGRLDPRDMNNKNISDELRKQLQDDARSFSRGGSSLFYPPLNMTLYYRLHEGEDMLAVDAGYAQEEARRQQENDEIAELFDQNDTHRESYYIAKVAELKKSSAYRGMDDGAIKETIKANLRDRRARIVMERAQEAIELAKHLDELSSPKNMAYVLCDNYVTIQSALSFTYNIDTDFLTDANEYALTEENKQLLQQCKQLQSRFTWALGRIGGYANPLYEYIDPAMLTDHNILDMLSAYRDDLKASRRGANYEARLKSKHKNYEAYVNANIYDPLIGLLDEAYNVTVVGRDLDLRETYQQTVTDFGFTLGANGAQCTCEAFDNDGIRTAPVAGNEDTLLTGRPILFEQDGRVGVLSLKTHDGNVAVWTNPEALFNDSLQAENAALTFQMKNADPWYRPSSDAFKHMRSCFETITSTITKLNDSTESRDAIKQQYTQLRDFTTTYLSGKPEQGHTSLEQGHIEIARNLLNYVNAKLGQIEKVAQARISLDRFRDLNPEEIQNVVARRNRYPINAEYQANFMDRLATVRDKFFRAANGHVVGSVNAALGFRYSRIIRTVINDPNAPGQRTMIATDAVRSHVAAFVGASICGELILQERTQMVKNGVKGSGPLEIKLTGTDDETVFLELGKAAARTVTGKNLDTLNGKELVDFLCAYDVNKLIEDLDEIRQLKTESAKKNLNDFREKVDAFQLVGRSADIFSAFNTENVTEPLKQYSRDLDAGKMKVNSLDAQTLLANCIISSLIQIEAKSGADVNRLLRATEDPDGLTSLQQSITSNHDFQQMFLGTLSDDGLTVQLTALTALIGQHQPQKLAKAIIKNAAFKQNVNDAVKASAKVETFRLGGPNR